MRLPAAQVITDPLTGRSKGYGFVRFGDERERDRALVDMMGHLICGRPVRVSTASSKKTVPGARYANPPHPSDFDPANTTLFIGGLAANVTEEDLEVRPQSPSCSWGRLLAQTLACRLCDLAHDLNMPCTWLHHLTGCSGALQRTACVPADGMLVQS